MATEDIQKAQELKAEGFSIREIATALSLPKSSVHLALKNASPTESNQERKPYRSHHEEDQPTVNVEAIVRELDRRNVEKQKKAFVGKFNRIVNEVFESCVDSVWDADDVEELIEELDNLQENLLDFGDRESIDVERLAIYDNADYLIEYLEEKAESEKNGEILFDEDRKTRVYLTSLKVTSFDQLSDNEDNNEDYDDDDDDDEDNLLDGNDDHLGGLYGDVED